MKLWGTKMQVLNQVTKELIWVDGMRVKAFSRGKVLEILDKFDYDYLVLDNQIVSEIPCKKGTLEPDWGRMIDYETITDN